MSTLPSDTPRLPKWPFLAGDAALLAVAVLLALYAPKPYALAVILVITGCVVFAALLGVIPFLTAYTSNQDEALDERQRGLEALMRTVSESGEQISIAANSLQEFSVLAQKQLQQAEDLPDKLAEQARELTQQLDESIAAENQKLRQELATLRRAETDKLQAALDELQKAATELAKREGALSRQLTMAQALLDQLPDLLGRACEASAQTLTAAQADAVRKIEAALKSVPVIPVTAAAEAPEAPVGPVTPGAIPSTPPESEPSPPPAPAKKEPAEITPAPAPEAAVPAAEPGGAATDDEPPTAPLTVPGEEPVSTAPVEAPVPLSTPEPEEPKPPRKPRAHHKPKAEPPAPSPQEDDEEDMNGELRLGADDDSGDGVDEPTPTSAISNDGATRLLVTAYIGIGNRLFVRGEGPGLKPDKGVPLQFVSIGKWRWETNDAAGPVKVRLYKNDKVECAAPGEVTIKPGHQTEVSARF